MPKRLAPGWVVGGCLVAAELIFGLRAPLFRDELYYLACADHLAWSYVDHPPLSIGALWAWRGVFGDSQLALRALPALLGLARVVLTARLSRTLGGGRFAEWTAALLSALAPVMLGSTGLYSMNVFDLLFWALALLLVGELANGAGPRRWLWLGLVVGLGLLNKWSLLFFLAGLGVGLLITPLRRQLAHWEPWAGLALIAVLQLPQVVWQVAHGWPTLEFIANATQHKNLALSPLEFALGQVQELGPFALPLWLSGLAWLSFARDGRYRVFAVIYAVAFAIFVAQHGKPYYLAPAYPPLFAAAGLALEALPRAWARGAVLAAVTVGELVAVPFAIPVLPPQTFVAYSRALGVVPARAENNTLGPLPQHFADRFGWEELAQKVAALYGSLSPEDQARAVIVTDNYGEAGALDYYGRRAGLPRALSQHNSYYLWAPSPAPRLDVVIIIGQRQDDLVGRVFRTCTPAGAIESPWAMPYEKRAPILLCRELLVPAEETWREGRHFI
jgi:hypothetical protein